MCKKTFYLLFTLVLGFSEVSHAQGIADIRDRFVRRVSEDRALVSSGMAGEVELDPATIKVLIWNIKKAELPLWRPEFMAYSSDVDLVLIQEAYRSKVFLEALDRLTGLRWDMGISFINTNDGATASGTMIGSRVEPREVFVRHSPDLEHLLNTPKSMTFAKYPLRDGREELLVISIHAINFTGNGPFKRQIAIAHQEIQKHKGPVLYAGDFNTWSESRLALLYSEIRKLKLTPVAFTNGLQRMSFSDNFLDHAFVRGLNARKAEVLVDSKGSDHKPLTLELELK